MLFESALALLRLHVERHGEVEVDESPRAIDCELARAGLMRAVKPFAGGPESAYRLTKEGFERKAELLSCTRKIA